MKIGYMRITQEDDYSKKMKNKMLELGIDEEHIFIDVCFWDEINRPQYEDMKTYIREGDELYIDCVGSLGSSYTTIDKNWFDISKNHKTEIAVLNYNFIDTRKFREMGDISKLFEYQVVSLLAYMFVYDNEHAEENLFRNNHKKAV